MAGVRYYIKVPYMQKEEAKKLGAHWDPEKKLWYYSRKKDADKFSRWESAGTNKSDESGKYMDVESLLEMIRTKKEEEQQRISRRKIGYDDLSDEQKELVKYAKEGRNILVDACIGSGKTTAIQVLCDVLNDKRILYLTYNRLLKIDAREKIKNKNVHVTNYHGFCACYIRRSITEGCAASELIQTFLRRKDDINIPHYDILMLDEYQDIEEEIAQLLYIIKERNPGIQIIAVGDMKQKIYDKTTLNVPDFINNFLQKYTLVNFTKCFRLSASYANQLGEMWEKEIKGMNSENHVIYMSLDEVTYFLSQQEPGDILCLGSRNGSMSKVLNELEERYPDKFNKKTVYAAIREEDGSANPDKTTAIFTTYDSSKGLERPCCVIFDFTEDYWDTRVNMADTDPQILRNIFCVAASRGKDKVIYVRDPLNKFVDKHTLMCPGGKNSTYTIPFDVSQMYAFKYKENVEECYGLLDIEKIKQEDEDILDVKTNDELIDLTPCISVLQRSMFFNDYSVALAIEFIQNKAKEEKEKSGIPAVYLENASLEEKVLLLTAMETGYSRYVNQVKTPFISEEEKNRIKDRLATVFSPDEKVQVEYSMEFREVVEDEDQEARELTIVGIDDVEKDGIVYSIKFVKELEHDHFLQCAMYSVMKGCSCGILWNIRNNDMYKIKVKDRDTFVKKTIQTITKGNIKDAIQILHKKDKKEAKNSAEVSAQTA